jgi:hypothetical protein
MDKFNNKRDALDAFEHLFEEEMKEMERFANEMELPLWYVEEEFFVDGKFVPVFPS